MHLNEYQNEARKTAIYPSSRIIDYPLLGLAGEVGELCNKYKKAIRGDVAIHEIQGAMEKELGDVLWYVAALACDLGTSLEAIAQANLKKLAARAEAGTIKGNGDER